VSAVWRLLALAGCAAAALVIRGAGTEREPTADADADPAPTSLAAIAIDPAVRHSVAGGRKIRPPLPRPRDVARARKFAAKRSDHVSFAVIDTHGELHGYRHRVRFPAGSIVKAPLLVARLRELGRAGAELTPGERERLAAMIRWSDNDAADAAYATVGDPALIETAEGAGMRRFAITGHWGNAQITAADGARFMARARRILPERHRRLAMGLLAGIVTEQRWGIPEVARGWRIWFKGGWTDTRRGELVSQVALLRRGDRRIAVAILTDGQPSQAYGRETLHGIAARLLKF
jgi:hypothetical protein